MARTTSPGTASARCWTSLMTCSGPRQRSGKDSRAPAVRVGVLHDVGGQRVAARSRRPGVWLGPGGGGLGVGRGGELAAVEGQDLAVEVAGGLAGQADDDGGCRFRGREG